MKVKGLLVLGSLVLLSVSCKKESSCTCVTTMYENGSYNGTETNEYLATSAAKCADYEISTSDKTVACAFAE